jgi:hypothetical protein
MNKTNGFIVTTTINRPTKAILKFCNFKNWNFVIVGDLKTPHKAYQDLSKKYKQVLYLHPRIQEKKYQKLSQIIGWNKIQRRNIGFIEAYKRGAEVIATVDDDNIPYDFWGKKLLVNRTVKVNLYETKLMVFDPLSITKDNYLWHRGYPVQLIRKRLPFKKKGLIKIKALIQADLWDGHPDVDAIARLVYNPYIFYSKKIKPFTSNKISPFNSQNTFLSRKVIPYYAVLPYVGRMDDIWGSYILQHKFPNRVIYNKASVYQDRNKQDVIVNMEDEMMGYKKTLDLLKNLDMIEKILPKKTQLFYELYKKEFSKK